MDTAIVSSKEIAKHPTRILSAKYWANIKAGKLPFFRDKNKYVCSHITNLNEAIYMTYNQAYAINIALEELEKAKFIASYLLNIVQMKAILIKEDGTQQEVFPANGTDFTLKECYDLMGCNCIEVVRLADGRIMIVDEDGKQKKDFQINKFATALYQNGRKVGVKKADIDAELKKKHGNDIKITHLHDPAPDSVCGNVIVCEKSMVR